MSRINFAHFRDERPDLREVWDQLEQWLADHSAATVLEARRLSSDLESLPVSRIAEALELLVRDGVAEPILMVRAPDGALQGGFKRVSEIPSRMHDRLYEHTFKVGPGNIVPVFRLEHSKK